MYKDAIVDSLTDQEFNKIRDLVYKVSGIKLTDIKKPLVVGRLKKIILDNNFNSFTEYYNSVVSDKSGNSLNTLITKISTNHTYFNRESEHFDFFTNKVLPVTYKQLVNKNSKDLRVWCAASSSGEEPYMIMMRMLDFFENKPGWDLNLLATDISHKVLNEAIKGIYNDDSISKLPVNFRNKYFNKIDDKNWQVKGEIRKKIMYKKFNLMHEFPFKDQFDVIFIRNVMIYFDQVTRQTLVEKLYKYMKPGGFLFIGHSETLNNINADFKFIQSSVYRKL